MAKVMLDLFSGSGSVSKVARKQGWGTVTLDRDLPADLQIDIMDWDCTSFNPKFFDFVWASPPCTDYSRAKTTAPRNIEYANNIVERTLKIINFLNPDFWVIENPQSGLLKDQPMMQGIPYVDVDYCKYGMPYRKRTRLWSNRADKLREVLRPLCKKDCDSMDESGRKHKESAQRMPQGKAVDWGDRRQFKREDLYKIPEDLVKDILNGGF